MNWRIAAITLFCTISTVSIATVAQDSPPNQASPTASYNGNRNYSAENSPPSSAVEQHVVENTETTKITAQGNSDSPAKPDWWARITNIFIASGTIVIVGAIASCAAIKTLRTIARQTAASVLSAKAAKDSADALVNIEKAWIEVFIDFAERTQIVVSTSGDGEVTTIIGIKFNCENFGKTPAWVTIKQIGMIILSDDSAAPDEMPRTVDFAFMGPELVGAGKDMAHNGSVQCEGRITKGHPALIYGTVTYHDIFRAYRTTTFGYWVKEGGKLQRLPFVYPTYNQHT